MKQKEGKKSVTSVEIYRGLVISKISIEWAEQQDLNYLIELMDAVHRDEEEEKSERKAVSPSEIARYMV